MSPSRRVRTKTYSRLQRQHLFFDVFAFWNIGFSRPNQMGLFPYEFLRGRSYADLEVQHIKAGASAHHTVGCIIASWMSGPMNPHATVEDLIAQQNLLVGRKNRQINLTGINFHTVLLFLHILTKMIGLHFTDNSLTIPLSI